MRFCWFVQAHMQLHVSALCSVKYLTEMCRGTLILQGLPDSAFVPRVEFVLLFISLEYLTWTATPHRYIGEVEITFTLALLDTLVQKPSS